MSRSDVAVAAAVGGASGVLVLVAFAATVSTVNTARQQKKAAPKKKPAPKLSVVPAQ